MTHLRRALLSALGLLVMACSQAAPAGPTQPAAPAGQTPASRSGGILRLAQDASDLGTLDPHFASGTQDRVVADMVFNGLLRYKPGDGRSFEPDLATSLPEPQLVNGKQEWTFALRKGVMCQPTEGVPAYELTSDDVVYSLQKSADKDRSAYSGDYTGVQVAAVDPSTVKVTLDQPQSTALFYPKVANYAGGFILCKRAAEKLGPDGLKTHPVGTGPFAFKSYTPKDKVELVANDAYFRGKPQLDGVEVRYMGDLNSRELGLLGGQIDVIVGAHDDAWIDKMQANSSAAVDIFGVGEVTTIHFNQKIPPLDKLEVRQAIAYALDRDEFAALNGTKATEKVYSPVPIKFMPGGLTQEEAAAKGVDYKTDREKAKQMLSSAGFANGFTLSMVSSEQAAYRTVYESMQNQLSKVGIKVDIQVIDHATYHSTIRKDTNPLVVYVAFRPNADAYLTQFYHSDSIVVTGPKANTNFSHYDKIDNLIVQARAETDPAKQEGLWKEAQLQILQDMVSYPVMYTNQVYARTKAVDYGHELVSELALYPGFTEQTRLTK
jgi:peptide/nickel transport system substrate-binding protein